MSLNSTQNTVMQGWPDPCSKFNPSRARIVRVFVTDPDADLPLDNCILYQGKEQLTDATDNEIFLTLGIPELLNSHNAVRRSLELKDIRARDLRMAIVTLVNV